MVTPPLLPVPAEDFQWEIPQVALLPGGNATNFSLQTAALGARVTFIGCLGSDPLAEVLKRAYRAGRVNAKVRIEPKLPTGHTVALTWTRGRRGLITAVGANAGLKDSHVPSEAFEGVDHFHRAGFWWTPGLLGPPTVRLLTRAQKAHVPTSLDVSTDPQGWPSKRVAAIRACLTHVDTLFVNEGEACAIAGPRDPLVAAERLVDRGAGCVVLHRGEVGSAWVGDGKVVTSPAFRVSEDNPTGCGDVFNGGYVFALLTGASVGEALGFGNACAALHLSDRSRPYPTLRDLRGFFRASS